MTTFGPPRTRKLVITAALTSVCLLIFFTAAHHTAGVHASSQQTAQPKPPPNLTPVLVELFTSEGCSSCPPADALLARLQQQQPVPTADVIALEEHVDYWDQLGWHDRFSAHQFTDRQNAYAKRFHLDDIYTPQMIVDGTAQFVGNDSAHALRAITQATRTPKPTLTLSPLTHDIGRLNTSVSIPSTAALPKADLYAALIETAASTSVRSGENGGHTLHHVSVVRDLQKIGTSTQLSAPLFFSFAIPQDAPLTDLRIIVFAQSPGQGPILAATTSAAPPPAY
jgi:hypothetical protein